MAFPLDEGLQLDSLWSSSDLYFENGLEDHVVSGQLRARQNRGVARCSSLSQLISCSVLVFPQTLRRHRKPSSFLCSCWTLSHRRWSPRNASVALEFGDSHSLAAAAFVTSKLLPERGLDVAPPQQQHQLPAGRWTTATSAHFARLAHSSLQPASTDFGPTTS